MTDGFPKYLRCNKCGQYIAKADNASQLPAMCVGSVIYRTSGICGGSFTVEMTEEEYNTQLNEWEEKRNKKDV